MNRLGQETPPRRFDPSLPDPISLNNKYKEMIPFGEALEALKNGKRIARKGWNGKGMFLFLLPGGQVPKSAIHDPALRAVIDDQIEGDTFEALGSIRMWTTNNEGRRAILTGWLASQTDLLSEDWEILS